MAYTNVQNVYVNGTAIRNVYVNGTSVFDVSKYTGAVDIYLCNSSPYLCIICCRCRRYDGSSTCSWGTSCLFICTGNWPCLSGYYASRANILSYRGSSYILCAYASRGSTTTTSCCCCFSCLSTNLSWTLCVTGCCGVSESISTFLCSPYHISYARICTGGGGVRVNTDCRMMITPGCYCSTSCCQAYPGYYCITCCRACIVLGTACCLGYVCVCDASNNLRNLYICTV